jgi:hypothetical protein
LAYASQSETPYLRNIRRARKIRMSLGAGFSFAEGFPNKPPGSTGELTYGCEWPLASRSPCTTNPEVHNGAGAGGASGRPKTREATHAPRGDKDRRKSLPDKKTHERPSYEPIDDVETR